MEEVNPGTYIVAVSGGVDSMVLLDMLRQQAGLTLVVAHADHGVRGDSYKDTELVREYAATHNLAFVTIELHLGADATEAEARRRRYDFLQQCSKKTAADGIILAHHQDDLIETAIIAIMRGTGWRGLAPFVGGTMLLRPLLGMTKNDIIAYARRHNIAWREDSTNADERYLRNYVRRTLVPMLDQKSEDWHETFLQRIRKQQVVRQKIENNLTKWLDEHAVFHNNIARLKRYEIIMLPHSLAYEVMQQVMRRMTGNSLERHLAEAAILFIKTAKPHKIMELSSGWQLRSESANVIVVPRTP